MKRLVCNLIVLLCVSSSAFTATHYAPTSGGLIQHPGFEEDPAGALTAGTRPWVGEEANQANVVNDPVNAHTGNQYFAFADGGGQLMQMVSVTPNTGYLLTAWTSGTPNLYLSPTTFVGSNMASAGMFVAANTGYPDGDEPPPGDDGFDGPPLLRAVPITTSSDGSWQQISLTFNSGPYSSVSINFDDLSSGNNLQIDDVSLDEQPVSPHPTLLSATGGDGNVALSWTDTGASTYAIWRVENNNADNYEEILTTLPGGITSYNDSSVTNGNSYTYQVAAIDAPDQYIFSNRFFAFPSDSSNPSMVQSFNYIDGAPNHIRNDFDGYVGLQFTTGSNPVTVTQLGRFIPQWSQGDHVVALFDASGAVLGSVTVPKPTGDYTQFQQFQYTPLDSPVTLQSNTTYFLGSLETSGGDLWMDADTTVSPNSLVTINSAASQQTGGAWQTTGGTNNSYGPVDLIMMP